MVLRDRTEQADFFFRIRSCNTTEPAAHATLPSIRTEQADFFFRIRSRECVGLRRETSAASRAFGGMKSLFLFPESAQFSTLKPLTF